MCEFCLKHGEGKKWYLQANNYSDELLSDIRRRRMIQDFFTNPDQITKGIEHLDRLDKTPKLLRSMIGRIITGRQKKIHFGQVVPIEEIEMIFDFAVSIVRVACICRYFILNREKRYCYGVSLSPDGGSLVPIRCVRLCVCLFLSVITHGRIHSLFSIWLLRSHGLAVGESRCLPSVLALRDRGRRPVHQPCRTTGPRGPGSRRVSAGSCLARPPCPFPADRRTQLWVCSSTAGPLPGPA